MADQDSHEDSMENSISVTRHKIIFVGDAGVGKTSLIARIIDNPFNENYEMSIGVDFCSKNIRYRGQNIKLQIWDSAGQEKYKGLIPSYVRNSALVFVVYDVGSKVSFDNLTNWINFIKSIEKTNLILCGNKIDLATREVNPEAASELAKKEGIPFYEVSAKTNENVKKMFFSAVADLPTFSSEENKEALVDELMEENSSEVEMEGNSPENDESNKNVDTNNNNNVDEIVVNGKVQKVDDMKNKEVKSNCKC